jgi:hypothetical protein
VFPFALSFSSRFSRTPPDANIATVNAKPTRSVAASGFLQIATYAVFALLNPWHTKNISTLSGREEGGLHGFTVAKL